MLIGDKKKKIACVITLYNQPANILLNIETYAKYIDVLYIVNNNINSNDDLNCGVRKICNNVQFLSEGINIGIARALNMAIEKADEQGYEWLLTMDQDSYFCSDQAKRYFESVRDVDITHTAILSPSYDILPLDQGPCIYSKRITVCTSGNLLNVGIAKKTGMFDEQLFIDFVDHDYCLRANSMGYRVLEAENCYMIHQIGDEREFKTLFGVKRKTFHSPQRIYFMVRNSMLVASRFQHQYQRFIKGYKKDLFREIFRALKYSNRRVEYIACVLRAYNDHRRGVYGNSIGL